MLEILQHCNEEYVPTNADKSRILQKIPLGGDHLTVERAVSAVNAVADADSPYERLHGLVLKHEDFHCEMNFLQVINKAICSIQHKTLSLLDFHYCSFNGPLILTNITNSNRTGGLLVILSVRIYF